MVFCYRYAHMMISESPKDLYEITDEGGAGEGQAQTVIAGGGQARTVIASEAKQSTVAISNASHIPTVPAA